MTQHVISPKTDALDAIIHSIFDKHWIYKAEIIQKVYATNW